MNSQIMKKLYTGFAFTMALTFATAQIDTIDNGKSIYIDSAQNLKMEIPFKKRMVDGTVKGFDLTSTNLMLEGSSKKNQKQGTWNYYEYDSLDNKIIIQYYSWLNDTLNGPFQELKDSLQLNGGYSKNLLNGAYKESIISIDDSGKTIVTPLDSGQYIKGVQYGLWTYLNNGNLHKVGSYEKGKLHLHWKVYDTLNAQPQRLMQDIQYFEGVKTGSELIYFKYLDGKTIKETESIPWQMGELSGLYSKKDAKGIVLESGTYSEDIKIGKWIYRNPSKNTIEKVAYLNNQLNGPYQMDKNSITVIKGTYALDKKNKTWSYYSETGDLTREEFYENGIKSGEWNYYNGQKLLTHSIVYDENKVVELYRFNKNGDETLKLELDYSLENYLKITAEEQMTDSSESVDLMYQPEGDTLNENTFLITYLKSGKDTSVFKRHGGYSVTKTGSVEYRGVYSTNIKQGDWSYFYNPRIVWKKVFKNGILSEELFLDKSSGTKVEKGEYVLWFGPERPQVEFKIQNGLRDGKSIWYKKNGEELKVEKYKDGMLN
jgi:antitoxin component YwqK of YwqJK toxin-antitoxin module